MELKCLICQEYFIDPRILTCKHTFCFSCLHITKTKDTDHISCPECGFVTSIPSISGGVAFLERNYFIEAIRKFNGASNGKKLCNNCLYKNQRIAVKYCSDCDVFVCTSCLLYHNKFKSNKNHEVIDVQSDDEQLEPLFENKSFMCKGHRKIELNMYCMNCKMLVCPKCSFQHFKQHVVKDVEEVLAIEKNKINAILTYLNKKLKYLCTELEEIKTIESDIKTKEERIMKQIDDYHKKTITEIFKKSLQLKTNVSDYTDKTLKEVRLRESEMNKSKKKLETLKENCLKDLNNFSLQNLIAKKENNYDDIPQVEKLNYDKLKISYLLKTHFKGDDPNFVELYEAKSTYIFSYIFLLNFTRFYFLTAVVA